MKNHKIAILLCLVSFFLNTIEAQNAKVRQFQCYVKDAKGQPVYKDKVHQAKIGISSAHYTINPGELIPNNSPSVNPVKTNVEHALESGIFAEDNLQLTPRLAASVGLRYSYFVALGAGEVRQYAADAPILSSNVVGSRTYTTNEVIKTYGGFEPRIAFRYDVNAKTSIKFAYNLMRQYIQTITNTTTPLPTSRWKTADGFIKPQISNAASLGWFHNFKENIYEASIESYYRQTDNILEYKQGANLLLQEFPETELLRGQNKSYGLEIMGAKKKGDWTGWMSYTFSKTLNQVTGINDGTWFPSNYDRPHTFNFFANLNYNKFHNFSFTFVLSSGRPFSSPQGKFIFQGVNYPYYPARNNDRLPVYHRLDFSWNILTTQKENKKWQNYWTFSIYNLYGRANPYSIYFNNKNVAVRSYGLKIFAAPIPSLSYNAMFR